ncbi:hypothetical protein ACFW04_005955 [Cataglyphis niger]
MNRASDSFLFLRSFICPHVPSGRTKRSFEIFVIAEKRRVRSRSSRLASGDHGRNSAVWTTVQPVPLRKSRHANYVKDEELCLKCPRCGRGYKFKPSLLKHVKYECGGRRNFCCNLCGRSFTQNVSLRRHLMQSHNFYQPPKKKSGRKIIIT